MMPMWAVGAEARLPASAPNGSKPSKCSAISAVHGRSSSSLLGLPTHCNPSGMLATFCTATVSAPPKWSGPRDMTVSPVLWLFRQAP